MKTLNRINLVWTIFWLTALCCGCTTSWTSEASNIIALLGPSISSILGIISAFGLGLSPSVAVAISKWSTDAQTALSQVATLINQYNAAEASAQPGLLVEIQTLLSVVNNNLSSLLPTVKVTNPTTQAKIEAIAEAFQSELAALVALVPALQGTVTSHEELKRLVHNVKTGKEFKADFNQRVDAFGPAAEPFLLK